MFSIGSWSFHELHAAGKMSIFGYLESIKYRYQLDSADIWSGMLLSEEDDYVQMLVDTLRDEGISVASLAVDGADVWDDDPSIRERNYRRALAYIDIARKLGAKTLRFDVGGRTSELTEEQLDFMATRYREYAHLAHDSGFRVGPQTHAPAAQVPRNIKRLFEAVDSPAFGVIIDVSRWIEEQDIGDELCTPYAMHLHFDSSRTSTYEALEKKVRMFVSSGYRGCWSLEYRLGGSEYLGVASDLANLRRAVYLATH